MSGSLRVHHLNCAHFTTMSLNGRKLACHILLVETPADGLVLVDTGLGSADYADISSRLGKVFAYGFARPGIDPALAAIEQIQGLGFDPKDVRTLNQALRRLSRPARGAPGQAPMRHGRRPVSDAHGKRP